MLVDVGKDPIGSLLGLHGLHRTFRDQRPAPGPRRIIDFVHDALADGRRRCSRRDSRVQFPERAGDERQCDCERDLRWHAPWVG